MMPSPQLIEAVVAALNERAARREGAELRFRCPEPARHTNGDAHPSARFHTTKAVWRCDACGDGGGVVDLARRLGLAAERGASNPRHAPATLQRSLTLAQYAAAKQVPIEFLRGLGVADQKLNGLDVVRIPYHGEEGTVVATRLRLALTGDRFRWRKASKPQLYGLSRLADARAAGYVVIVEGESDCQTLWLRNVPAIGIPGATSWKPTWSTALDGIENLYVVIEPDAGGDAVLRWLATVPFRDRVRLVHLAGART